MLVDKIPAQLEEIYHQLKDEDVLVDKIISYLDNDCKMEDEYSQKVKKFFKYTDKNNCKRVYEWIYNH